VCEILETVGFTLVRLPREELAHDEERGTAHEEQDGNANEERSTIPNSATESEVMRSANGLQEQVRCRAYELYEQRGKEDGHEIDDWLQAESELTGDDKSNCVGSPR
jgi:hypothetical protein